MEQSPTAWRELLHHRPHVTNVNEAHEESLSKVERLALWITDHVGTMGFFFVIFSWTVFWLSWNLLAPKSLQFDPPMAFVFWLFISNMIQILLMPLIMVGQNLQGRHAELRAESDYAVNVRSEKEIALMFAMLQRQEKVLGAIVEHLGIEISEPATGGGEPFGLHASDSQAAPFSDSTDR